MTNDVVKKDVFKSLAFSVYGNVIGLGKEGELLSKTAYFVATPRGDFFLLAHRGDTFDKLDYSRDIIFSIIKEESTLSEMSEMKAGGILEHVAMGSQKWEEGLALFEEKSPYIRNLPWIDAPENYLMFFLEAKNISYQKVQDERDGKEPVILVKN